MGTEPDADALDVLLADATGLAVARELCTTAPTDFVAARGAASTLLAASGRSELARAVRTLRKPNRSAWLLNVLSQDRPGEIAALIDLHAELARAHAEADVTALRSASAKRTQRVGQLLRALVSLATERGGAPTAAITTEVEQTLQAAVADPAVGRLVALGVLRRPQQWSGFGVALGASAPTRPTVTRPPADTAPSAPSAHERAVARAEKALTAARKSSAEAVASLRRLRTDHDEATEAHDEASRELAELLDEVAAAEAAQASALERRDRLAEQIAAAEAEAQRLQFAVRAAERERADLEG